MARTPESLRDSLNFAEDVPALREENGQANEVCGQLSERNCELEGIVENICKALKIDEEHVIERIRQLSERPSRRPL
jgi:hypothetical protein